MREIKFRAWDKEKKIIVDVYSINGTTNGSIFIEYYNNDDEKITSLFDDFEIMQYTGLKDKNGKEIYEGDVINNYGHKYVITYIYGGFTLSSPNDLNRYYEALAEPYATPMDESEIIGNRFENPELLDEE